MNYTQICNLDLTSSLITGDAKHAGNYAVLLLAPLLVTEGVR